MPLGPLLRKHGRRLCEEKYGFVCDVERSKDEYARKAEIEKLVWILEESLAGRKRFHEGVDRYRIFAPLKRESARSRAARRFETSRNDLI